MPEIKMEHHTHKSHKPKRTPLWKWLLIIALVIAMPLFFLFVRTVQLQQALITTKPVPQNQNEKSISNANRPVHG